MIADSAKGDGVSIRAPLRRATGRVTEQTNVCRVILFQSAPPCGERQACSGLGLDH